MFFWILKTSGIIHFRRITVDEKLAGAGVVGKLDDFFAKSFQSFGIFTKEDCEDRYLSDVENLAASRLIEEEDVESQNSESSGRSCWNLSSVLRIRFAVRLVALWAISDTATEQLMCRFYEHLVRGESACESLNQAMKWLRGNGFNKVFYWAPFMLIGDNVTFDFGKR